MNPSTSSRGLFSSPVLHRKLWPSTWDKSFGIPFVLTPILVRCAFSRLDYGSLSLRPVVLLALLSELTRLPSSHRGRLHPGFRRLGHPPRRRISLQCQLGNLHWQDFHLLDHQLASLHYPGARISVLAPNGQHFIRNFLFDFENGTIIP